MWNVPLDAVLSTTVACGWDGCYMLTSWRPLGPVVFIQTPLGIGFGLGKMGNSLDKLRHPRSVAYSAEQVIH